MVVKSPKMKLRGATLWYPDDSMTRGLGTFPLVRMLRPSDKFFMVQAVVPVTQCTESVTMHPSRLILFVQTIVAAAGRATLLEDDRGNAWPRDPVYEHVVPDLLIVSTALDGEVRVTVTEHALQPNKSISVLMPGSMALKFAEEILTLKPESK